jgi:NAD(P)-dependent dehydrogenase (short-subunit alcohol dehydrogenase family)
MSHDPQGVLVLGARNLGGAVARAFMAAGWRAAAVSRSPESLEGVRSDGALGITADAADLEALRAAIDEARAGLGRIDAIVNAVSASRPPAGGGAFGGGPLAGATLEGFEGWTAAVARQAFAFLSAGMAALPDGGTLVQVTGGSARRANPGRGLWAAGSAAVRALTQAAALEGRGRGIHVGLLIVDGVIGSPKTAAMTRDMPPEAVADQDAIARAALYLAQQPAGALTHELQVTPAGDRWVP